MGELCPETASRRAEPTPGRRGRRSWEQLNATMWRQGTVLVAFTLTSRHSFQQPIQKKRHVHLLSNLIPIFEGEGRVAHRPRFARECNADHDRHAMGKNRERVRFSPRPGRRGSPGEGRTCRTRRAARWLSRLLRGEISSCSTSWRGAGTRAFRSEIARRHAGGPRLSRPHPGRAAVGHPAPRRRVSTRRNGSEVKSRGVMREGCACRGRT